MHYDEQPSAADVIGGVATPGAILTRMREVDADVRGLGHEIEADRDRIDGAFVRGWRHWRDAWFYFYGENEPFHARIFPQVLLEVEGFARRLPIWRQAARRAGVDIAIPENSRPPPSPRLPRIEVPTLDALTRPWLAAAPVLAPNGPLSAEFWAQVKPVAIAGAVVAGGLGLALVAVNVRAAVNQSAAAKEMLPLLVGGRGVR